MYPSQYVLHLPMYEIYKVLSSWRDPQGHSRSLILKIFDKPHDFLYIGWQWQWHNLFIPYLCSHDVGQVLQNVCYCNNTFSMIVTGIFLNQLIQFYSNNATNLRHVTSVHSTPCCPTTEIALWPQIIVTSLHPVTILHRLFSRNYHFYSIRVCL